MKLLSANGHCNNVTLAFYAAELSGQPPTFTGLRATVVLLGKADRFGRSGRTPLFRNAGGIATSLNGNAVHPLEPAAWKSAGVPGILCRLSPARGSARFLQWRIGALELTANTTENSAVSGDWDVRAQRLLPDSSAAVPGMAASAVRRCQSRRP